jgi:hypothetical protein
MNSIILYNASDCWRKHRSIGRFSDFAQLSFSKRSMNMCMSIEQRCIYVDRGKQKYSEKDLFQCHFAHHKSDTHRPTIASRSPRWKAGGQQNSYLSIYRVGHKSFTTLCKSQSIRNRWITTICDKMAAVKVTPPNDFPLGLIRSHMVIHLFLMLCDLQRVVRDL